jgi:Flp pilus assembly protein TadD
MSAKQAVVCPRCGALNRPTWDFCARCNESLEGAGPAAGTPDQAVVVEDAESRPSSFPGAAIIALTVLAVVGLGLAAWRHVSTTPPPSRPDPGLFTMGTRPSERPSPPAPPAAPGASDYDEGRRLLQLGDVAGAVARFEAAVAADPANAEFHNAYGRALWRSEDRDGALAQYAEAARLDPRLQMQYARTLEVAGHSAEAAQEYEALLARNPDATMVHEDLGRLLFRNGEYTKAAAHLQQALPGRPDDLVLQQELAYALDQAGDRRKAESTYREVLRVAPGASYTRVLLAESLAEQGRGPEALALIQEGLRRSPDVPVLQRQLASVLERSGQRTDAAAAYRAYARLAPNAPDARAMADRAARLEAAERPQ